MGLNPFEVREVLQVIGSKVTGLQQVSIPLKSGRCCKLYSYLMEHLEKSQSL